MSFDVKNTTMPSLLELIAPHSCRGCGRIGATICDCCKKNIILAHQNFCPNCKKLITSSKCSNCQDLPITYTITSRTGLISNCIHDLKYHSTRALAKPLAEILHQILPIQKTHTIIVPLPTIKPHIRARGLDHTLLIAKKFAKLSPNYHVQNLLLRGKNTVQVGADKKTRIKQAANAYILNSKIPLNSSATYILFDDVWTTGASMKSAIKILKNAGIKHIIVALLAYSEF